MACNRLACATGGNAFLVEVQIGHATSSHIEFEAGNTRTHEINPALHGAPAKSLRTGFMFPVVQAEGCCLVPLMHHESCFPLCLGVAPAPGFSSRTCHSCCCCEHGGCPAAVSVLDALGAPCESCCVLCLWGKHRVEQQHAAPAIREH